MMVKGRKLCREEVQKNESIERAGVEDEERISERIRQICKCSQGEKMNLERGEKVK